MKFKVRVVALHPETRSMSVQYFIDEFPEGMTLHMDFPEDPMPEGEDLKLHLVIRAPVKWLETKQKIATKQIEMKAPNLPVGYTFEAEVNNKEVKIKKTKAEQFIEELDKKVQEQ